VDQRPETLKQLQEVVGITLEQIGIRNDFLCRTQKAQHLRERMNKWDCIKLKLLHSKRNSHQLKRQLTEWKKIFASYSSNKGLISRIYRELKKLKPQRVNILMKK
jgi:hypothetical protein